MMYLRFLITSFALALAIVSGSASDSVKLTIDSLSRLSDAQLLDAARRDSEAGRLDIAEKEFFTLCSRFDPKAPSKSQRTAAEAFNAYGMFLNQKGAYPSAMDYYLTARRIAEKNGFLDIQAEVYANLGNVYGWNSDYDSAEKYFLKALPLLGHSSDRRLRPMLLKNLVAVNYLKQNVDSARHYADLYKNGVKRDPRYEYDVLMNEALIADIRHDMPAALDYARRSAILALRENLPALCIGASYSTMAEFFEKTGRLDSALVYFKKCDRISQDNGFHHIRVETLNDISRIYSGLGRKDLSLEFKSQCLALADSINFSENSEKLRNSQALYDLESSAEEINDLNRLKQTQRDWLLILSGFLVVSAVFIIVLIRQKRKLKAAWSELYERNRAQIASELKSSRVVTNDSQRRLIADAIRKVFEESDEFCSPDFSIDRLAMLIDSNARYVSEVINDEFGMNFRALLNDYRVKKAMIRLEDTENYGNFTIRAIAESVGYKSQTTFITAFTRQTGLKPGIYQKLARDRAQQANA